MSSLLVKTAIRGEHARCLPFLLRQLYGAYHVYSVVWETRVGESFVVLHESGNDNDRHAMAVLDIAGTLVPRYSKATLQNSR